MFFFLKANSAPRTQLSKEFNPVDMATVYVLKMHKWQTVHWLINCY